MGNCPKALLIAPTTSLVATIAMQSDTAFQIPCNDQIHVVHGTHDIVFCPNQSRWTGENVHLLRDNHIFLQQSSQRVMKDLLTRLLDETIQTRS